MFFHCKRTSTLYVQGRHMVRTRTSHSTTRTSHYVHILLIYTCTLYGHIVCTRTSHCTFTLYDLDGVRRQCTLHFTYMAVTVTRTSLSTSHFHTQLKLVKARLTSARPKRCYSRRVTFKVCLASFATCWPLDWARGAPVLQANSHSGK